MYKQWVHARTVQTKAHDIELHTNLIRGRVWWRNRRAAIIRSGSVGFAVSSDTGDVAGSGKIRADTSERYAVDFLLRNVQLVDVIDRDQPPLTLRVVHSPPRDISLVNQE